MKKLKVATFSMSSVHANPYIVSLPINENFDWVAASIDPKDKDIPDLRRIPADVKLYETEEALLNTHPDMDVVILLGSNDQTYKQFKLCVKYGIKNILLMKIPSLCIEEYEEMQRLAAENEKQKAEIERLREEISRLRGRR